MSEQRIDVPNTPIYIWIDGQYDLTRWLSLSRRGDGTCVMHLSDLCHPGKLSRLASVSFPMDYLKTAVAYGSLQITLATGFLLLRRSGSLLHLEFKSLEDLAPIKADIRIEDLNLRIDALEKSFDSVAVLV